MYLVFDIGGTKMRFALSSDLTSFITEPYIVETPKPYADALSYVREYIKVFLEKEPGTKITAVAGGIAGTLAPDKRSLVDTTNIGRDWIAKPLASDIAQICSIDVDNVYIENDCTMVGLGELFRGVGSIEGKMIEKEDERVAYITVSTGVGGALFTNGHPDESVPLLVSQVLVKDASTLCPECVPVMGRNAIDLEAMISGSALEKRTGRKPYEIQQEDPLWDQLASFLSMGLRSVIATWKPSIIILGGSMMVGNPRITIERVAHYLVEASKNDTAGTPPLYLATLESLGGLHGGLVYLEQKIGKV